MSAEPGAGHCGILTRKRSLTRNLLENVLFELGIAVGCERPLFVVAELAGLIPFSLASYPYVLCAVDNTDVLRFHLNVFLKNLSLVENRRSVLTAAPVEAFSLSRASELSASTAKPKSLSSVESNIQIEDVRRELNHATSASQLNLAVAKAFEAFGAKVVAQRKAAEDFQPDLVAWLNEPAGDLGTVLLVEAKATIKDSRYTDEVIDQIAKYMSAAGVRAGLLLAPDADDKIAVRMVVPGYVFVTSPNTLLTLLATGKVTRGLAEARNRFVHSGA